MASLSRSLFTANERIKTEYCNLQTDYKTLKTENNQMKLRTTEMQGKEKNTKIHSSRLHEYLQVGLLMVRSR